MFLLKKIVSQFLFPLPACLLLGLTGLILIWCTRRQKLGKVLVTLGTGLLTLCSYGFIAEAMLAPFESQYPVYQPAPNTPSPKYVVVLGGGHVADERLPLSSQAHSDSLKRLIEAIQIHRSIPGSQLLLSGGGWAGAVPNARVLAGIAQALGVRPENILLEERSRDTRDEVLLIKPVVGTNQFILVTSASHMPRSMALFQHERMNPVAAPADHLVKKGSRGPAVFFPQPENLSKAHRAVYELLGSVWGRLRGEL